MYYAGAVIIYNTILVIYYHEIPHLA